RCARSTRGARRGPISSARRSAGRRRRRSSSSPRRPSCRRRTWPTCAPCSTRRRTAMIEAAGHSLVSWLVAGNLWTAVLLCGALVLDRALARRAHASLRIALYVPVALRVVVPLSWTLPVEHVPNVATVLPIDALAASAQPPAHAGVPWYAAVAIAY